MTATTTQLARIEEYVMVNARPLDVARFRHAVYRASPQAVIAELEAFQNADGGFGKGLEPDFRIPDSSAIATWVGLQLLIDLGVNSGAEVVRRALEYVVTSYDADVGGWPPVPATVNEHPHANWWHYETDDGGTKIHQIPWNPTAAIAGYLWHYDVQSPGDLIERAIEYLREQADSNLEMHELNTFVQLANLVPADAYPDLPPLITVAVNRIVNTNPEEWGGYGAQPLAFVTSPSTFLYEELRDSVEANLDYWLDTIGEDGAWLLPWDWGRDEDEFQRLRPEITASLTVQRTIVLRSFGRLAG